MDNLNWIGYGSRVGMNTSSVWSNFQQGLEERFLISNSNPSTLFNSIQELPKDQTSPAYSIPGKLGVTAEQLSSALDSTNAAEDLTFSQHQEAARLIADTLLLKPGEGPPTVIDRPYTMNPLTSFATRDVGVGLESQIISGLNGDQFAAATCSLESLDCLLSATRSNIDTSVEDDGVSMILTDYTNLWNFGSNAVSSGESESNGPKERNNERPYGLNLQGRNISATKSNYTNRSNDQIHFKVGDYSAYSNAIIQSDSCTNTISEGGFRFTSDQNMPKQKKPRSEKQPSSSNINFQQSCSSGSSCIDQEPDAEAIAQMKEMIYRAAAFRPVNLGLEMVEKPKRKNVRISTDPQTVAARQRRERISERISVLQRLVPGGSKMDTASMLDEAANYLKFLKSQIKALENLGPKLESLNCPPTNVAFSFNPSFSIQASHFSRQSPNHVNHPLN